MLGDTGLQRGRPCPQRAPPRKCRLHLALFSGRMRVGGQGSQQSLGVLLHQPQASPCPPKCSCLGRRQQIDPGTRVPRDLIRERSGRGPPRPGPAAPPCLLRVSNAFPQQLTLYSRSIWQGKGLGAGPRPVEGTGRPPRPGPRCHTWVRPKRSVHLLCKGKVDLPINFHSGAPSPSEGTVNIISLQMTLGGAGRQFVGGKEWEAARGPGMLIFTGCRPRYLGACTGAKWGLHLQLSSGGGGGGDVSQRETAEIIL